MQKTAIVTGAARGIGRASALALARAGFAVAMIDMREKELVEAVDLVRVTGVPVLSFLADTADHQLAKDIVAQVVRSWDRVDVLLNNAAVPQTKRLLEITEAEWDFEMAVNLKGYFNWSQAVAPQMQSQARIGALGGRMINISSVSAHTGGSQHGISKFAYAAAKAGVLGLTKGLAKDLAPDIAVNAICPGSIETDRTREGFAPYMNSIIAGTPMGRVGTPEDIAVVVAFLATMEPCFMTGEVIDVDGGASIN